MTSAPLAQSADRKVLFSRLGLNEQIHKILLQEAQIVRDSLSRNPHNLTDQSRTGTHVQTPYKWDEISETAKHRDILTMVNNAPPHTKYYYAMGCYQTNVCEENWVARWYLWHSFRYRDNREPRPKPPPTDNTQVNAYRVANPPQGDRRSGYGRGTDPPTLYWDAIRGIYR